MRSRIARCALVSAALAALAGGTARAQAVRPEGAGNAKETVVLDGSTTVGPIAKAFAEYYMEQNPNVNVTVNESGSGNGAKSLIAGTCDIANMSRFMKEKEFQAAVEKGVMPVAHVVAMDGIAVVVNAVNPIKGLTIEQIRDIYTGKVDNWKQLGGPDMKIVVVSRETTSGTYETFNEFVMDGQKVTPGAEYVPSNAAAREAVLRTRGAVAYAGLGFTKDVRAVPVNGVTATPGTVVSGRYPIARPLYMFTNGYPELGSHVHAFVTLHLTRKGQEIVEGQEFVPVTDYRARRMRR